MIEHKVIDAWSTKDFFKIRSLYGNEVIFFDPLLSKEIKGKDILGYAQAVFTSFPDLEYKVISIAHASDLVMIEWKQCGTNTGPIIGRPPTGKYIEIPAVSVLKSKEGQLISHYDYWDMKRFLREMFNENN